MKAKILQWVRLQIQKWGYDVHPIDHSYYEEQSNLLAEEKVAHIFDVGANVGRAATCYRELFPDAHLTCIEPISELASGLRALFPNHTVLQAALSDNEGVAEFHIGASKDVSSLLKPNHKSLPVSYRKVMHTTDVRNVETVTLDALLEDKVDLRIDLLKMDLQGGEMRALQGAKRALASERVSIICTEAFLLPFYQDHALFGEISGYLHNHGYALHGIYNPVFSGRTGRLQWMDAIFVCPRLRERSRAIQEQRMLTKSIAAVERRT